MPKRQPFLHDLIDLMNHLNLEEEYVFAGDLDKIHDAYIEGLYSLDNEDNPYETDGAEKRYTLSKAWYDGRNDRIQKEIKHRN